MKKIIIVIFIVIFVLFLTLKGLEWYSNEQNQIQKEKQQQLKQKVTKDNNYTDCIIMAYKSYSTEWENKCAELKKDVGCTLSSDVLAIYNQHLSKNKDDCNNKYSK